MKFIASDLKLVAFAILDSNFRVINPTGAVKPFDDYANKYEIEIDYTIKKILSDFHVFVKIAINKVENPVPGYTIFAEGVSVFTKSEKSPLPDSVIGPMVGDSGVSIAINALRSYIGELTAKGPAGPYILPLADLTHIVNEKKLEYEKWLAKQKTKKKAVKKK